MKGAIIAGGSLSFSQTSTETLSQADTKAYSLYPRVGFLLSDRWAAGLAGGYTKNKTETNMQNPIYLGGYSNIYSAIGESTVETWQVGPFVRYYVPLTENLFAFGHVEGGISRTTSEVETATFSGLPTTGTPVIITDPYDPPILVGGPSSYSFNSRETNGYFGSFAPGLVFFPAPQLGIEVTAGEISYRNNDVEQKEFNVNLSLSSLRLGLSFYLGRSIAAQE